MSDTSKRSNRRKSGSTPAASTPRRKSSSAAAAPKSTPKRQPKKAPQASSDAALAPTPDAAPEPTPEAAPEVPPRAAAEAGAAPMSAGEAAAPMSAGEAAAPMSAGEAAAPTSPRRVSRSPTGVVLWTVVSIAVLVGIVYATAPIWSPRLGAHLPAALRDPFQDPRMVGLGERVRDLEARTESVDAASGAIRDLEDERARFSGQLKVMMERVDDLEAALASVRKMVDATSAPHEAADAEQALRRLSERLTHLEEGGPDVDVDKLATENARLSAAVAAIAKRVGAVEETDRRPVSTLPSGRAVVVAVGQLREALRGSGPFAESLEAVKAMAGDDPGMAKAIAVLEPDATTGIATLAALRADFEDTASRIVGAEAALAGDGLVERTLNRLSSLVRLRRTDGAAGGGASAFVARAEASLAGGDLDAAVVTLEELSGAPAEAAQGWLDRARRRLAAERALVTLHILAIARVGSAGG